MVSHLYLTAQSDSTTEQQTGSYSQPQVGVLSATDDGDFLHAVLMYYFLKLQNFTVVYSEIFYGKRDS